MERIENYNSSQSDTSFTEKNSFPFTIFTVTYSTKRYYSYPSIDALQSTPNSFGEDDRKAISVTEAV